MEPLQIQRLLFFHCSENPRGCMSWDTKSPKMWLKISPPSKLSGKFGRRTYSKPPNQHGSWNLCGEIQRAAVVGIKSNQTTRGIKTALPKLSLQSVNTNWFSGMVFHLLCSSCLTLVTLSLHSRIRYRQQPQGLQEMDRVFRKTVEEIICHISRGPGCAILEGTSSRAEGRLVIF